MFTSLETTSKEELTEIISSHLDLDSRTENFSRLIRNLNAPDGVVKFLNDFVNYNAVFAGGVSMLAARLHFSNVFNDSSSKYTFNSDRSSEVASRIFFAAEDEYGQSHHDHTTHRQLAQKMMTSAIEYYGLEDQANELLSQNKNILHNNVANSYGANWIHSNQIPKVLNGIGFHIASELSADRVFSTVYDWVGDCHKDLLTKLRSDKAHIWLKAHCSLEIEHFESALDGMILAIKYLDGSEPADELKYFNHVLDGIAEFGRTYDQFVQMTLGQ